MVARPQINTVAENGPVTTNILVKLRQTNPSGWAERPAKTSPLWSSLGPLRLRFRWLDRGFFGPENDREIMRFQTLFEGRWIFAILLILAIGSAVISWWLSLFFVALILYTIAFFRDPDRSDPADQRAVVAAADGTVADIQEIDEEEFLKARSKRIGIFLSIFDVHTNRAPVDGRIAFQQHRKGFFFDARRPECSEKNEAMTWAFQNPRATIVVRQLTGAIARRIVAWAKVGDELKRGQRFGMIRFGSRTEVYLPFDAEILVKVGDHVKGGASVIARLPE
jgi:phosphatidylserine decarboxylase